MKNSLLRILKASAYSAITILLIVATIILVAIGRGYFFDIKTGSVSGGGLILLSSRPGDAQVIIDDKYLNKGTPLRINLKAGTYKVRLEKDQYRAWQKDISVFSSEVSWAQYPFLFPSSISTEPVTQTAQPIFTSQSPDKKYSLIGQSTSPQQVSLYELGKSELKPIFTLSSEQINQSLTLGGAVWAQDSEHVLLSLNSPTQTQYVVLNVLNPSEQENISKDFGVAFSGLQFSTQNWQELYWQSPEGLRKIDLANQTISAVLAPNTVNYKATKEAIFLIQNTANGQQLMRLERDGKIRSLSAVLPASDYTLSYSGFAQTSTVVLIDKTNSQIFLFDPTKENQTPAPSLEHVPTGSLATSPDERYLLSYKDNKFISYDFEFKRSHRFELASTNFGPLNWLDNFHVLTVLDGAVISFEFDGANIESIVGAQNGFEVFATNDQKNLYSMGRSEASGNFQLQASVLKP